MVALECCFFEICTKQLRQLGWIAHYFFLLFCTFSFEVQYNRFTEKGLADGLNPERKRRFWQVSVLLFICWKEEEVTNKVMWLEGV